MLPPFTPDGLLPPGVHRATWPEVESRFGQGPHRALLTDGLRAAAETLRKAGLSELWLDGSYVTAKPEPGDYDGVWDPTGVDIAAVDAVLVDVVDLRTGRYRQKAKYRGELLVDSTDGLREFFQRTRDDVPKGIVLLELWTLT